MTTTIKFQFDIDQHINTPRGPGCVEAMGLFWQPDGGQRIRYLVDTGRGAQWFEELTLKQCNREGRGWWG